MNRASTREVDQSGAQPSLPASRNTVLSADSTRELQDPVGRFARAMFVVGACLLALSIASAIVAGEPPFAGPSAPFRIAHAVGLGFFVFAWRRCVGPTMRARTVEALDAGQTVAACALWAIAGASVPDRLPIAFSLLSVMSYTLVARSIYVPSTFVRTLAIGAVSAVPTVALLSTRAVAFAPGAAPGSVEVIVLIAVAWGIVAVLTASFNSHQLYGLRARIREIGKLGQYTLEEKIGEGGMGVVYRATHAMLRRPAAIKLLLPDRAGQKDLSRFEREVQLTSRLAHPNTISIFDYGRTADGVFYYVMEYLEGTDLQRLVEEDGPLEPARAIHVLAQAAGALGEAHALGLIHRDIKPANIVLTERADEPDVVKVLDFGLVKTLEGSTGDTVVTNADTITGTPMYLAPEAIRSPDSVDARSDLYALGAVGYFLLTGEHVFDSPTVVEVCSRHLLEEPMRPSERLGRPIASDLESIILACLAKSREARPASAVALRTALLGCQDAGRYDVEAARRWWRERAAGVAGKKRAGRTTGLTATMAVDLRGRREAVARGR